MIIKKVTVLYVLLLTSFIHAEAFKFYEVWMEDEAYAEYKKGGDKLLVPYVKLSVKLYEKCFPWRDGKYITIDKNGCFATLDWGKKLSKDTMATRPVCNFPNRSFTQGYFSASPETGWVWTWDSMKLLCYNADTGLHSDFIPVMSWKGSIDYVIPISSDELLLSFFWLDLGKTDCIVNFLYNQRTQFLDMSHINERSEVHLWKQLSPFGNMFLAFKYNEEMYNAQFFFYNNDTGVKTENKLTRTITQFLSKTSLLDIYVSTKERMIVSKSSSSYPLAITWSEKYGDVVFSTAKHVFPKEKYLGYYEVSSDCRWMFLSVSGYKGLKGDILDKVAFLEISDKYPGMFSPLIFLSDDYTDFQWWGNCSFIEHPEYGTCFICSYDDNKTEETRLYKMSDIQAEIDRVLTEKAKSMVR